MKKTIEVARLKREIRKNLRNSDWLCTFGYEKQDFVGVGLRRALSIIDRLANEKPGGKKYGGK